MGMLEMCMGCFCGFSTSDEYVDECGSGMLPSPLLLNMPAEVPSPCDARGRGRSDAALALPLAAERRAWPHHLAVGGIRARQVSHARSLGPGGAVPWRALGADGYGPGARGGGVERHRGWEGATDPRRGTDCHVFPQTVCEFRARIARRRWLRSERTAHGGLGLRARGWFDAPHCWTGVAPERKGHDGH